MSNQTRKYCETFSTQDNCKPLSQSKYKELDPKTIKCDKSQNYFCQYKATGELVCTTGIKDIHDYNRKKIKINHNKKYKEVSSYDPYMSKGQCLYDAFGNLVCDINSTY